ncbi:MAG TPA: EamA family transporter RarD [Tepidisphaeraceae bacterium]|nr:EamA family transporter RarD [Tepidisphaeraceae bacterium]
MSQVEQQNPGSVRSGLLMGIGGYLIWGLVPIYYHQIEKFPAGIVLCHRIVWSFVLSWILLIILGRRQGIVAALRSRKTMGVLCLSTMLLACNWFTFIYTIDRGQIMQAAIGYFILPLVTCALGMVFLKERLRRLQTISVVIAAVGVLVLIIGLHQVPTVALILAFAFGFYGLVRKISPVGPMVGTGLETTLMAPIALIGLFTPAGRDTLHQGIGVLTLLMCAGFVTVVPLVMFTTAARRLRLTSLSFCQYVGPTCQLMTALFYGEAFTRVHQISFGLIWTALALYSFDSWRAGRNAVLTEAALEPE